MWLHAALLLVALAVARAADEAFDVCIIGAGVAGLQAAATLQALAPKLSVCIVDGRERVGGRVHSVESQTHAGLFFEHGASWIHGIINNPIYALAQQHHITTIPTDWSKVNVSLGAGRWLTPFQVIGAFAEAELAWYAADAFAQRSAPVDFSVQAVYDNTSASPAWDVNVQAMRTCDFDCDNSLLSHSH